MILEWYFLVSMLTGPFDSNTELGWSRVQRYDFSAPSVEACEVFREGIRDDFANRLQGGEGLVVTGCQSRERPVLLDQGVRFPQHIPSDQSIMRP